MVRIPQGSYEPLFKSQGMEIIEAFLLDPYPVTNEQYLEFVQQNPRWQRSKIVRLFSDKAYLEHWESDLDIGDPAIAQSPVTHVSWFAARAYAQWKDKRLPTQAEWEYVAAASKTKANGKEDKAHYQYILNWYAKPTPNPLPPIGSTFKNFFGIYDIHGLVWEWVEDFNTALVTGESRGDTGLERNLFCGSGAVGSSDFKDYAAFMRYALRSSLQATYTVKNLGFRCAKDLPKGTTP